MSFLMLSLQCGLTTKFLIDEKKLPDFDKFTVDIPV